MWYLRSLYYSYTTVTIDLCSVQTPLERRSIPRIELGGGGGGVGASNSLIPSCWKLQLMI